MLKLQCDPCEDYNRRRSRLVIAFLVNYWWDSNFVTTNVFKKGWNALGSSPALSAMRMIERDLHEAIYG